MTDPRFTDPGNDPLLRRDENVGSTWGWIAGLAVLALIAFVLIAGWNSNPNTASNGQAPPMTTGSTSGIAPMRLSPPSTTGSGTTSPMAPTPVPENSDPK